MINLLSYLFRSLLIYFFFSSRRRHTRSKRDWSSDVCSSDLEGDLPADAGDELEGHLPVVDVEGSELLVENVRLDPAGAAFERRIRAHRDRRRVGLSFAGESRPPGVDSVGGHEPFGVIGQVRRREAEVAAAGVAVDDGAVNGVVAAELIGHLGDIAGGELFADARGRIAAPTSDLVDRLGPEPVPLAEAAQRVDGALIVLAEAHIIADDDDAGPEGLDEVG